MLLVFHQHPSIDPSEQWGWGGAPSTSRGGEYLLSASGFSGRRTVNRYLPSQKSNWCNRRRLYACCDPLSFGSFPILWPECYRYAYSAKRALDRDSQSLSSTGLCAFIELNHAALRTRIQHPKHYQCLQNLVQVILNLRTISDFLTHLR